MSYKIKRKEYYAVRPQWIKRLLLSINPSLLVQSESVQNAIKNLDQLSAVVCEEVERFNDRKKAAPVHSKRKDFCMNSEFGMKEVLQTPPTCRNRKMTIERNSDSVVVLTRSMIPVLSFKIAEV